MKKVNNSILNLFFNSPFHIAKRDNLVWWKAWLIRIVAVVLALIV